MTPAAHPLAPEMRLVTPRDLAWLCGALALAILPHAVRAPWWLTLLTCCLFGWRFYYSIDRTPLPSRWLVLGVAAVAMLGVWVEYRSLFGRQPGILLLVLFAGLKVLETRSHRDATAAAFLGYFLIITNFLYSQSIPTAVLMCLAVFTITATLVGFSAPGRAPRAHLRTAALLLGHALPAALVLFLLFPRVQTPLWGLPQDAYSGLTGLSESMTPGNLSSLALSDAIAFRAEFKGEVPPRPARYWRGPVMWDFDGRTWSTGDFVPAHYGPPKAGRATYHYDVVLEPHNHTWLFALETAASVPPRARYSADGQLLARQPVRTRTRYEASSIVDAAPHPAESAYLLRRGTRLPAGVNPKAMALAAQWRASARDDGEVLSRAVDFFRKERFTYTLEPPLMGGDSVDQFLFDARAGFCEHFSSAFVFLMRAAGIPARVVTGYQGGEVNPYDNIVTVRQSDAHAWAEVFLRERGWVRVDPTAAAVPGRLESGLARSVPQAEQALIERPGFEWLRSVRYQWEALAHKWNVWVLGYNPERQREFMSLLGIRDADWRSLTATLFTALGLMTAALLLWSLRRLARPDPVQRAWRAFCRKLAARGVERSPHEGPRDFAERAARALPAARRAILSIAALYIGLRYGPHASARRTKELRRRVRELHLT